MSGSAGSRPKQTRRRVPKLSFTKNRGIGYHVSYRDPVTGSPRRHRFGMVSKAEAELAYHRWLAEHLDPAILPKPGRKVTPKKCKEKAESPLVASRTELVPGCLAEVASGFLDALEARVRGEGEPRAQGTIGRRVFEDRRNHVFAFLGFLKERHSPGVLARSRVDDLSMADVEAFNRSLVDGGYSASQVNKRMQMVKGLIDRAGRPEHGGQVLQWNWDSRDVLHGKPSEERTLPTLPQLKKILAACELREQTMIWMAIGMGFGQKDLAMIRVGQIDKDSYDLRRSKTGLDRYGETPPLVWACITAYLKASPKSGDELLFQTRTGRPLIHGRTDAVTLWWNKLRTCIGESKETLQGFYVLRHLGATEYGSRPGCSLGDMRRWLGHSASSSLADVYMKPVAPERKKIVEWVRERLASVDV